MKTRQNVLRTQNHTQAQPKPKNHRELQADFTHSISMAYHTDPTLLTPDKSSEIYYRCPACFKQFKQRTYFVDHIRKAGHSLHDPRCAVCQKHCRCLDALREHLTGPLARKECAKVFADQGCPLCLSIFETPDFLAEHRISCQFKVSQVKVLSVLNSQKRVHGLKDPLLRNPAWRSPVALDCEMVGGGEDGSVDLCARICMVDEDENVLFSTYVKPEVPVTDYRFQFTGIHPQDLVEGMSLKLARKTVEEILYNGPKGRLNKENASLLVGHSLHHDLNCLGITYPLHLQRDTAYYPLLLRTSNVCNKLQYLTKTYLGYTIQEGKSHDPYEDAVAAMRLYKRMKIASHTCRHVISGIQASDTTVVDVSALSHEQQIASHPSRRVISGNQASDINNVDVCALTHEQLMEISRPRFRCWCLDS